MENLNYYFQLPTIDNFEVLKIKKFMCKQKFNKKIILKQRLKKCIPKLKKKNCFPKVKKKCV